MTAETSETVETSQVTFDLPETESEVTFLQEYMVPAWDRFEASEDFESGWFWRAGNFARHDLADLSREDHDLERLEPGMITFVVNGDPGSVIETEREYWREFEAEGLLEGWETRSFQPTYRNAREKMHEKYGREGGDRVYLLRGLAAELTVDLLAAFDEPLPAVGEPTDDDPVPVGFWAMNHFLMKPQGYDWYEEIDACTKSIRNRARSLAAFTSEADARDALDDAIGDLEAVKEELGQ